jgi:hypothetical protein
VVATPGTLRTEQQARELKLLEPQQLYELWERHQWVSQDIDFSADRVALSQHHRRGA